MVADRSYLLDDIAIAIVVAAAPIGLFDIEAVGVDVERMAIELESVVVVVVVADDMSNQKKVGSVIKYLFGIKSIRPK